MNPIHPQLQSVLDDFAIRSLPGGKHSVEYQNLVAAISASPVLNERLNTAAEKGYLDKIAVNQNPHAGASYHAEQTKISLNLEKLKKQDSQKVLVFQLGHEIQHAFYHYEQGGREVERQTQDEIRKIAAGNQAVKDYTKPLQTMLRADRENEALAMVAGWNAVVGYEQVRQRKSNLSLDDVVHHPFGYEQYFLDKQTYQTYSENKRTGKLIETQGLKFNPDMSISPGQKEILAQTYFDQAPIEARLGRYADSDYRNNYAGRYIGFIVEEHYRHPEAKLVIDMKALGLDERLIERNGLDLGAENRREAYYEKSRPQTPEYFDHTRSGERAFQHVPITHPQNVREAEIDRLIEIGLSGDTAAFFKANREFGASSPNAQSMMDQYRAIEAGLAAQREQENRRYSLENMPEEAQKLHREISGKLTAYAQEHNLPFTERGLQNSIAALTAQAYAQKLSGIDRIALSAENRLVVLHEGYAVTRIAEVDAGKAALSQPQESYRQILQTEHDFAREAAEQQLQRQMEQSRGMSMGR